MKLINVDDIKWQKGVFVNPMTNEPLQVIHKMATIEMLRDWQEEVKAIPLDKVKQAREEMESRLYKGIPETTGFTWQNLGINMCLAILDKLIEESE
jgi:homoaconitase/3-isopropylmalate dehydratase large subunit